MTGSTAGAPTTASGSPDGPRSGSRSQFYDAMLIQARELFSRQGYRGTSTRDIAQAVGSSEALVFRHFGSKEKLFEQAVLEPFEDVIDSYLADGLDESTGGTPADIRREVERLYDLLHGNRSLIRSLIAASGTGDGPARVLAEHGSPLRDVFARLEARIGHPEPDRGRADVSVLVRAAFGMVLASAVLDDWLFDRGAGHPSRERVVDELAGLVLYGCATRPTDRPSNPRPTNPPPPLQPRPVIAQSTAPQRVRTAVRQRRSRHEVRRLIVEAARELFSAQGYSGTTTKEIADRAAVSETSLYRHFESKQALFEHAIFDPFQDWIATYLTQWDRGIRTISSLETQSKAYVTETYDMLSSSRALIRSLIATSAWRGNGTGTSIAEDDSPLSDIFIRLEDQLAELAAENRLRGLDIEITVRATFGMVLSMAALPDWMFDGPGSEPSRARQIRAMVAIMVAGTTGRH